jgi:hypothetical protein
MSESDAPQNLLVGMHPTTDGCSITHMQPHEAISAAMLSRSTHVSRTVGKSPNTNTTAVEGVGVARNRGEAWSNELNGRSHGMKVSAGRQKHRTGTLVFASAKMRPDLATSSCLLYASASLTCDASRARGRCITHTYNVQTRDGRCARALGSVGKDEHYLSEECMIFSRADGILDRVLRPVIQTASSVLQSFIDRTGCDENEEPWD